MAYIQRKYDFASAAGSNNAEKTASIIFDAIEAMGFELHDQISTYERVYKTQGEAETGHYSYFWIDGDSNSSYIYFKTYGAWDATTHTGYFPSQQLNRSAGAPTYLVIVGNADFMTYFIDSGSNVYLQSGFGRVPNIYYNPVATLSGGVTSGSDKTLTVNSTADFFADTKYCIVDQANGVIEMCTVTAINGDTSMTVDSLSNSYAAGSLIGISPFHFSFIISASNLYYCCGLATSSTNNKIIPLEEITSTISTTTPFQTPVFCNVCADVRTETAMYANTVETKFGNFEQTGETFPPMVWAPSSVSEETLFAIKMAIPITGIASSSTATTLTDNTKSWTTDEHQGKIVAITGGAGEGQLRQIVSNTATTLTVSDDYTIGVTSCSYEIIEVAYNRIATSGNILYRVTNMDL